jgi:probable rRNA maturation factor
VNLQVDIQRACEEPVPEEDDIAAALDASIERAEVSVRLVGVEEMCALNARFRDRNSPTNVLSFPAELPPGVTHPLLGDIVVCAPVVAREAAEQHKAPPAHWAHMLVHGTLHLLGFDHVVPAEAEAMEARETAILASLDFPCPYGGASLPTGIASMG